MRKFIKVASVASIVAATLVLVGCSNSAETTSKEPAKFDSLATISQEYVELEDGRTVLCVLSKEGYSGGISCDWDTAGASNR